MAKTTGLPPYPKSLAGTLLAAREAVMAPIRPVLHDAGVTEQQWRVLRILVDAGPLDLTGMARMALLHPPSVTRIVRELLQRQLIDRTIDDADGRRSVVSITEEGRELVIRTAAHTKLMLDEYAARFGAKRLTALRSELAALTLAIENCSLESSLTDEEA